MHIAPGKYCIKNALTGTTFDEATDGVHIARGWQENDKADEHWLVQRMGHDPDAFQMKSLASGLYVFADGAYNGCQLRGSGSPSLWFFDRQDDGSVFITLRGSNYVADLKDGNAANGTAIHLWEKSGGPQQRWFFEPIH